MGGSRYSILVRWLKIGLPIVALALLSAVFLLQNRAPFEGGLIYTTAELVAIGEGLSVSNPRFTGATEEGEPFIVRADSAHPDKPDPELVTLENVRAEIDLADRRVTLSADAGELRPKDDLLKLEGAVRVTTSDGWTAETAMAETDVRRGRLNSPGPVRIDGPRGAIEAGSFRATRDETSGDRFFFENRVRVTYKPGVADQPDAPDIE